MKATITFFILLSIALAPVYTRANDEWNKYINDLSSTPLYDRARIADVPKSPPQTQVQLNALHYHKKLLLKDLEEVNRDISKGNFPPGSNALFQEEGLIRFKIREINGHLNQVAKTRDPARKTIPKQFHGTWTTEISRCGPDEDDMALYIDSSSISYWGYHSTDLIRVAVESEKLMIIEARYFGENQEWTNTDQFTLYDDGNTLGILGPDSKDFKRVRCPHLPRNVRSR